MAEEYKQGQWVQYNGVQTERQGRVAKVIEVVKWEGWEPYYIIQFEDGKTTEVIAKYLVEPVYGGF